jgi:hypothetical protein
MKMDKTNVIMLVAMLAGAAGVAGVLALSWQLKSRANAIERLVRQDRRETVAAVDLLRAALRRVEAEAAQNRRDVEQLTAMGAPVSMGQSVNMTKRAQALRMHRQGEPPEKIASVLGLPHREVVLLVKLQDVIRFGAGASA